MPDRSKASPALAHPLGGGRDLIIATATIRGLLAGVVALSPAAAAAALMASDTIDSVVRVLLLLLLGGAIGAILAGIRARRSWPRVWDLHLGLPQTVETTATLLGEGAARGEWQQQMLMTAAEIPPPIGASTLLTPAPRLAPSLLLILLAATAASLIPTTRSPAISLPTGTAVDRQGEAGGDRATATASEALAREKVRRSWRRRQDAALVLTRRSSLAPIEGWLRDGGRAPAVPALLTGIDREKLLEAARRLVVGSGNDGDDPLSDAARWLEGLAAGSPDEGPGLTDVSAELRRAAQQAFTSPAGVTHGATFRDPLLATGGSDSPGATDAPDGTDGSAGDSPGLAIGAARPVAPGERSVQDRSGATTGVAAPEWDRVLAHPEVEARWLPAIEAYRRQRQATGEEPR